MHRLTTKWITLRGKPVSVRTQRARCPFVPRKPKPVKKGGK